MWFDLLLAVLLALAMAPILSFAVGWRAPGRRDTRLRSLVGFFLPALLLCWGGVATLRSSGAETWGAFWMLLGAVGVVVALLLSNLASPPSPTQREVRRVRRRGELLDPVYFLYIAGVALGVAAAGATRIAFSGLA